MNPAIRFGLEGRVAVVTGAAQGIGAACARRLAAEGARVALWDVADAAGQALADELCAAGAQALYRHCNVALAADVQAALGDTLAALGPVNALVNNAGIFKAADFLDITEADWDAVIAVNLKGAFLVGQAVARAMAEQGGGAIVNMSSVNGVLTIPSIASYNVSKGGINQLTRVMALALADRGIRVNAVAPGTIATELAKNAVLTSDEARARIMSRTPMKRLGEPEEIADVVAYLLSDAASYVTGEIVTADGGRMTLNYTVTPCAASPPSTPRCNPMPPPPSAVHRPPPAPPPPPVTPTGPSTSATPISRPPSSSAPSRCRYWWTAGRRGAARASSSSRCWRSWSRPTKAASCWPS
jgi:NAD(P)-dependent dehydrogenase (short-subunit alcohol dehydrogenase family)